MKQVHELGPASRVRVVCAREEPHERVALAEALDDEGCLRPGYVLRVECDDTPRLAAHHKHCSVVSECGAADKIN
jgi:hypothetical protein